MGIHRHFSQGYQYTIDGTKSRWLANQYEFAATLTRMTRRSLDGTVEEINILHVAGERWRATEDEAVSAVDADVRSWIQRQEIALTAG